MLLQLESPSMLYNTQNVFFSLSLFLTCSTLSLSFIAVCCHVFSKDWITVWNGVS